MSLKNLISSGVMYDLLILYVFPSISNDNQPEFIMFITGNQIPPLLHTCRKRSLHKYKNWKCTHTYDHIHATFACFSFLNYFFTLLYLF